MATTVAFVRQLPGIVDIEGNFHGKTLTIMYDASQVSKDEIAQTIEDLGYDIVGEFTPPTGEQ